MQQRSSSLWSAPETYGLPIITYEIQVGSAIGSDQWVQIGKTAGFSYTGLTPETSYEFRVRAVTLGGQGLPSPTAQISTGSGSPPETPKDVRLGVLYSIDQSNITSIAVRWTAPYSDVPIRSYVILVNASEIRTIGSVTQWVEQEVYPGSWCNFSIKAVTEWGESAWSETLVLKAADPVPPRRITDLRQVPSRKLFSMSQATYADFAWSEIESWGLPVIRLKLYINYGTSEAMVQTRTCPCFGQDRLLWLQPNSTHTLYIEAENEIGWSDASNTVTLYVPDATQPVPPRRVWQASFNELIPAALHAVIGWDVPDPTGLPIISYRFLINALDSPEVEEHILVCDSNNECPNTYTFHDLSVGTSYNVTLQLSNARGWSLAAGNLTVRTTDGEAPRKIPYLLKANALYRVPESRTIHLQWGKPIRDGWDVLEYQLKIMDGNGTDIHSMTLPPGRTSYIYACHDDPYRHAAWLHDEDVNLKPHSSSASQPST